MIRDLPHGTFTSLKQDPKPNIGNTTKVRFDLLNPMFQEHVAKVFTSGVEKYGEVSYLSSDWENRAAYFGAMLRHLNAVQQGEFMDPESGEPHVAHIAANCQMLYEIYNKTEPRSFLGELIDECDEQVMSDFAKDIVAEDCLPDLNIRAMKAEEIPPKENYDTPVETNNSNKGDTLE